MRLSAYFLRGKVRIKLGDQEGGINDIKKSGHLRKSYDEFQKSKEI